MRVFKCKPPNIACALVMRAFCGVVTLGACAKQDIAKCVPRFRIRAAHIPRKAQMRHAHDRILADVVQHAKKERKTKLRRCLLYHQIFCGLAKAKGNFARGTSKPMGCVYLLGGNETA